MHGAKAAMVRPPPLIPELDVADLDRSLVVYVDVLGFEIQARRPEERFAYLVREGAHLMLEEAGGPGRCFRVAPLEYPFTSTRFLLPYAGQV